MMKVSTPGGHLPWRVSESASKVDAVANRCFYMIAMGKWPPGTKLPAVRRLESEWAVNRITVLKAYGVLASRGLVHHQPNGSFYVAEQSVRRDFARDRIVLGNLYEEVMRAVRSQTDLLPLGVLRMLARMAESRMRENPEIAFVECSRSQATDHAREIMARVQVSVLPLSLDDIRGEKMWIPSQVSVVLTTAFHIDELESLRDGGTQVAALPIEISPEVLAEFDGGQRQVVFLESDRDLAHRTCKDAVYMMGVQEPRVEIVEDMASFLEARLGHGSEASTTQGVTDGGTMFLIPQKEWYGLDRKWREHDGVKPISCKLGEGAWRIIADTLRIPFGSAA
jgi:DNA-binding transcriptional regulator YhcF (GntR family)